MNEHSPVLASVMLVAAVGLVQAQDTLTRVQITALRSRYRQADQWEIQTRPGTRLDSLRRLYDRQLQRIAVHADSEDRSPYPLWYRAFLRDRLPTLPKSGRYQYPRVGAQLLEWMASHEDFAVPPPRPPGRSAARGPARVAAVAANVDASNANEVQSESYVAVYYGDPRHVVASSNNISGSGRLKVFFSSDSGGSWNSTELPLNDGAAFHSDPAVAWAPDGTVWAATLGVDVAQAARVQMYRSSTRGATWTFAKTVSTGGANDKEMIWIDTQGSSPHRGNIYVAWDEVGSGMRFARSTDNGATWSSVVSLSSDAAIGAHLTSGPSGEVYVAWPDVNSRRLKVRKSSDGGASFGAEHTIATTNDQYEISIPAMCKRKVLIYVILGVDRSGGPRRGNVYAVWTDRDGNQADPDCGGLTAPSNTNVYFSNSTDGGTHWSPATVIHSNPSQTDQFNPWLDVDPDDGDIHVVYYDTRGDSGRSDVRLYHIRSADGGGTWVDEGQIATAPTDETTPGADEGNQFGDYNGVAVYRGAVVTAWTDRRNGASGGKEQIYTARIRTNRINADTGEAAALTISIQPAGTLKSGQTATARATVMRGNAPVAGEHVLFTILDPSIAEVAPTSAATNSAGVAQATVTARNRGNTTLTAAAAGQLAAAAVSVPALSVAGVALLALAMTLLALFRLRLRRT